MQSILDNMPECTRQRGAYAPAIRCGASFAETHKRAKRMQRREAIRHVVRALTNTLVVVGAVIAAYLVLAFS